MELDEQTKAIVSAITLLGINLLALAGVQLDHGMVTQVVAGIVTIFATLYAAWKNHNFTEEAVEAQEYLDELKAKR